MDSEIDGMSPEEIEEMFTRAPKPEIDPTRKRTTICVSETVVDEKKLIVDYRAWNSENEDQFREGPSIFSVLGKMAFYYPELFGDFILDPLWKRTS